MKFYDVAFEYVMEVEGKNNTIKQKKINERYLIKARSCEQASNIFRSIYDKVMDDYKIKSVKQTKYKSVISKDFDKSVKEKKQALVDQILDQKEGDN